MTDTQTGTTENITTPHLQAVIIMIIVIVIQCFCTTLFQTTYQTNIHSQLSDLACFLAVWFFTP